MKGFTSTSVLMAVLLLVLVGCSTGSNNQSKMFFATPQATLSNSLDGVTGIFDPTNQSWPRTVEVLNGFVTINAKPERILTVSLGHDEVTYALVPSERVVATSIAAKMVQHSNVAHLA